jgi:TolB-like protein/DNA-binding SARP family transcriptional activator/Tfp pilus assembly protein PilF
VQRLTLLGGVSIQADGQPLTGRAVQRRRLALLALLAAARSRGASRDKLIAYLWPDADAENGRHYLSDSVYRVNQALGGDVIVASGDELRLDAERLPSDLGDFEQALSKHDYERAVSLYAGSFMDGFFLSDAPELERWVESERDRLAKAYAGALEALAEQAELRHGPAVAVVWWRRLAAHDPYNSRVVLRLMRALSDAGDRAGAIQHARVHESLLKNELELEPDAEIQAFAERLRTDTGQPRPDHRRGAERRTEQVAPTMPNADNTAASSAVASEAAPVRARSARRMRPALVIAIVAVIALASLAIWQRGRASAARATRTIAVLPFANLNPDRETEYFSDGMTEELIATLGRVEGLDVASRTSSFWYKNRPTDVREVGKRLGVASVVEGSVRKSGRKLRIMAQLVSTSDGYRLWSDTYDREVEDVLAIQEEIARAIAARLIGSLRGAERIAAAERSTIDPEAYDLYLRGRFAWHERTRDGLTRAIDYFTRAVARAPEYARAHVGLGDAYAVGAFYDYLAPADAYSKAEAAVRRALELDPTLAAPHVTLGYILTYYQLDWSRAEAEFKRALDIDPAYSTAHQWYANLLTVAGRFKEAEDEMRLAQETDPLSLIANAALGWSFYYAGRYADALEQCRRTLALNADYYLAYLWGAWALEASGRRSEAREWIGRAENVSPGSDLTRLTLAHLLAGSATHAERDTARAIVRDVERRSARGEYVASYEVAKVHLALGDRGAALQWLQRAIDERSHSRAFLRVDPHWASLRGDTAFERLVASVFGRTERERS